MLAAACVGAGIACVYLGFERDLVWLIIVGIVAMLAAFYATIVLVEVHRRP